MGKREACLKLCNLDVKKGWVTLKLRMRRAFSGRDKTFYPRLGIRTSLPRGKIKMLVLFRDQFTVVTKKKCGPCEECCPSYERMYQRNLNKFKRSKPRSLSRSLSWFFVFNDKIPVKETLWDFPRKRCSVRGDEVPQETNMSVTTYTSLYITTKWV